MQENKLNHDDYCRIVGKVYIDAVMSLEGVDKKMQPVMEGFQRQIEQLRHENARLREERDTLQRNFENAEEQWNNGSVN